MWLWLARWSMPNKGQLTGVCALVVDSTDTVTLLSLSFPFLLTWCRLHGARTVEPHSLTLLLSLFHFRQNKQNFSNYKLARLHHHVTGCVFPRSHLANVCRRPTGLVCLFDEEVVLRRDGIAHINNFLPSSAILP